jgi:hypothetical protein
MKATLQDASLARYAGRFVWLELDFDKPSNQEFIRNHGVAYTPTLLLLDAKTDRAIATNKGGMTVSELQRFLEQDEDDAAGTRAFARTAAGDDAGAAQLAVSEAPRMARDEGFVRLVLAGLMASNSGGSAPWATRARAVLEPLAAEAVGVRSALRDHRFQLYQQLMVAASVRNDKAAVRRWGDRWLAELDATKPASDDERSALDIARVDAAGLLEDPMRVLPALVASERAMPDNYNASLRVAQLLVDARRWDDAAAACARGLVHVTGPLGRSWLLATKADALAGKHDVAGARGALEEALAAARQIGTPSLRDRNVARLTQQLGKLRD